MPSSRSEFEDRGPGRLGVFAIKEAWEKVRAVFRTGQHEDVASKDDEPDPLHFVDGKE